MHIKRSPLLPEEVERRLEPDEEVLSVVEKFLAKAILRI